MRSSDDEPEEIYEPQTIEDAIRHAAAIVTNVKLMPAVVLELNRLKDAEKSGDRETFRLAIEEAARNATDMARAALKPSRVVLLELARMKEAGTSDDPDKLRRAVQDAGHAFGVAEDSLASSRAILLVLERLLARGVVALLAQTVAREARAVDGLAILLAHYVRELDVHRSEVQLSLGRQPLVQNDDAQSVKAGARVEEEVTVEGEVVEVTEEVLVEEKVVEVEVDANEASQPRSNDGAEPKTASLKRVLLEAMRACGSPGELDCHICCAQACEGAPEGERQWCVDRSEQHCLRQKHAVWMKEHAELISPHLGAPATIPHGAGLSQAERADEETFLRNV